MNLYRISNYADLSGVGGTIVSGRWHTVGAPIVYLAEHPALALLEALVQVESLPLLPETYQLLRVETDLDQDTIVRPPEKLDPVDREAARAWGDAWLRRSESALARIPSVVAPDSFNYLLNPRHADARRVRVAETIRRPWDHRFASRA